MRTLVSFLSLVIEYSVSPWMFKLRFGICQGPTIILFQDKGLLPKTLRQWTHHDDSLLLLRATKVLHCVFKAYFQVVVFTILLIKYSIFVIFFFSLALTKLHFSSVFYITEKYHYYLVEIVDLVRQAIF